MYSRYGNGNGYIAATVTFAAALALCRRVLSSCEGYGPIRGFQKANKGYSHGSNSVFGFGRGIQKGNIEMSSYL